MLNAGYADALAAAKARNPHYREYPPGVANERVELPVICGLIDFLIYVVAIFPLAQSDQSLFVLWMLTIPFAFLSAIMPVGPVSAWYWRRARQGVKPKVVAVDEDVLTQLRARRQWLQELAVESVKVESELRQELENAGDLRFAFETHIKQSQETRSTLTNEIQKLDAQIAAIEVNSLN